MTRPNVVRKAVFPAAGLGTRFLPATKAQPKEMLPLVDKPIIQYGVEEAAASGVDNIILVTGRGKNAIEDHFDVSVELETFLEARGKKDLLAEVRKISSPINLSYVRQGEPLGLGHAVLVTRSLVGDEPFAVILADDVIDAQPPALKQMIDIFTEFQGPVLAIERVPVQDVSSYGIIDAEELRPGVYRIRDMVEKPSRAEAPSDLAIIGRYVLTPDIFPALEATASDRTGEIQLTNGLRRLLKDRPIYGCRIDGVRHDTGNKLGFLKAVVYFALRRPDLAGPFSDYLRAINLKETPTATPTTVQSITRSEDFDFWRLRDLVVFEILVFRRGRVHWITSSQALGWTSTKLASLPACRLVCRTSFLISSLRSRTSNLRSRFPSSGSP